jgi:hypothetical protein
MRIGGANAPYAAALDTRVKVVVGQVGFGDGERFLLDTRRFGEREELLRNYLRRGVPFSLANVSSYPMKRWRNSNGTCLG